MAVAQSRIDQTEVRLEGLSRPTGEAAWASEARAGAEARLRAMGLPSWRDEYWKFTNPRELVLPEAPRATPLETGPEADQGPEMFAEIDRLRLVFVDGVFDAEASDAPEMAGLEIARLSEVTAKDIHWAKDLLGVLETRGQDPVARPLAALNTAFATDGVVIRATTKAARPVHIVHRHTNPSSDAILHHLIWVEPEAELTLLEDGPVSARCNTAMEVEIEAGGAFHHVRIQGPEVQPRALTHMFSRLGTESTLKSFTLTANGILTRNEQIVEITGDDAVVHVAGAAMGDGAVGDFLHDDTIFITHDAVNCESRQVFKKVLRNGATGVFQGKILVKQIAQKTDGYQMSQSLLLDGDSIFQAKPELEIYADDVACSHGSTTGAIDETALFYLRSRGVPTPEATDLLVLAFLAEAIEEIEDEDLRGVIIDLLEGWMLRRRSG
ncbi:MAG: SufD family Fe-S cluster assembly protein [Pseudomonadota bacterium]